MRTTDELDWDLTVDFVCVGAGAGGFAAAIAAVDAGASALVANFHQPRRLIAQAATGQVSTGRLVNALGIELADPETSEYLAALIEDVEQPVASDDTVPVLAAGELIPYSHQKPGKRDQVPPFYGGRLGDWAGACVASPFGVVYSRVITDAQTPKRSRSGTMVEVAQLGTIQLDPDVPAPALDQWLSVQAHARGIDVHDQSVLRRLVFEEGRIVGAVFDTPTATLAVEARHGVMLACDTDGSCPQVASSVGEPTTAEVCLVREPLSRFSRLELHVNQSSVQSCVSARGR